MTITIDNSKTASSSDIGTYFFSLTNPEDFGSSIIGEKSVKLGDAMVATVDLNEHPDGFLGINQSVTYYIGAGHFDEIHNEEKDGYERSFGYTGFESRKNTLLFFTKNKIAILEVMDELIENGRKPNGEKQDVKSFLEGLIPYHMQDMSDVFSAYKNMITDEGVLTKHQQLLREKISLALVNVVIFYALSSYESLLERQDFIESFGS